MISHQKAWRPQQKWQNIFQVLKKRSVTPESYTQGKHPSEMRMKNRHSKMKKNERFCLHLTYVKKKMAKGIPLEELMGRFKICSLF